ncbi:cytokine receptor family member b2 [Centropristis striata]|uniref:cytokine receptor family member b2 n=1 Tax=Centropristis striata TaxID=184440 RepID=UPI0027E0D6C1|nr:cytokine receptor family member b2 [Centropristis striata]
MTAFIWMLALLPQVLPAMSELPPPTNLNVDSRHFSHVLTWEPGAGTPTGVYYNVTICTDTGTSWIPVSGCQHVQRPLVCNLTEALYDKEQVYFIQIKAATQNSRPSYKRFQPIRDTHLDLPLLNVTSCGKDLCVALQPPVEHLREIYDSLNYKLRITSNNADRSQFFKETKSLKGEIFKDVASGRQYCVSVCFSDSKVPRKSNYSQPACAYTSVHHTADLWISAVLCILVISLVLALLVYIGFIRLMTRPLPSVLTSIHHNEEVLVVPYCRTPLSSVLNLKPTLPSSVEKRSSQISDESDRESLTETTGGCRGGGYNLRGGTNPLSSSSSSSSSLSVPPSAEPELPPDFSSEQTSVFCHPQREPLILTETQSNAGLNLHTDSALISEQGSGSCPADTDPLIAGGNQPNGKERKMVVEGDSQDVNLLTLIFGRQGHGHGEEEKEMDKTHFDMAEVEPESSSVSVVNDILPSQSRDNKEFAIETLSCSVDEEEEEEHSGYMGRDSELSNNDKDQTILLKNLLISPSLSLYCIVSSIAVGCVSLHAPSNVSIFSFNMEHLLSFVPGPKTSDTHFTVQILSLRKNIWRPVVACLELKAGQTCNLTQAFKDPFDHYRARVQAVSPTQTSNWTQSGLFQPLSDTVLGPPDVSVSGCGNCLLLQLRAPTTRRLQLLKDYYRGLFLHVQRTRDGVQFTLSLPYKEENVITYLQTGVEYCVTVSVTVLFNSNTVSSQPYCAFTSPPPSRSSLLFSLLGALCALGFLVIGLVVYSGELSIKLLRSLPRTSSARIMDMNPLNSCQM